MTSVKNTVTVDWMHREAARARMRVLVKKILRKYGYPPDLQNAAVYATSIQCYWLCRNFAHFCDSTDKSCIEYVTH